MTEFITDCRGKKIIFSKPPMRIISLVPSITETLFALVDSEKIIGGTRFCEFPRIKSDHFTVIGGTKTVDIERIRSLQPDLILANKEENTLQMVSDLDEIAPVYVSDVRTIEHNIMLIRFLGLLTHSLNPATLMIERLDSALEELEEMDRPTRSFIYLIWKNPMMTIGQDTYISDLLSLAGFENCIKGLDNRYPEITIEDIHNLHPNIVFLSSEPYPFKPEEEKDFSYLLNGSGNKIKTKWVHGDLLSWYGVRSIQGVQYLQQLISTIE